MRESVGGWTIRLVGRSLEVAIGNPFELLRFWPRCFGALRIWTRDLFSARAATALSPWMAQIGRSFFRGVWVVLGLGLAMAAGLRAAGEAVGPVVAPFAENAVVKILVTDGLPLLLAVFLSGRSGAAMAARLGPLPALRGLDQMKVRAVEIREMIVPSLLAAPFTAAAFYYLVLLVAAAGYHAVGPLPGSAVDTFELRLPEAWSRGLTDGLIKSGIFGFLTTYTGAALGLKAAESYRKPLPETHDVHRAVWESAILGVVVCLVVSVTWTSLE